MKKTAVLRKPGDIILIAGKEFVMLDDFGPVDSVGDDHDLFVLALGSQGNSRFGETNNYAESELRRRTAGWLDELLDHGVNPDLIRSRTLDLTTLDGHGKYGELTVKAAPLTMDEARKYSGIIPYCDDDCWLATGWGGPEHYGASLALFVGANGSWYNGYCSNSYGIRPALVISSLLLPSEYVLNLSKVSNEDLMAEVRRRIEG